MITHKDVAHFYDLLAAELHLSVEFSKSLAEHLITGEREILDYIHSAGVESLQDAVYVRDLPHYPLNFIGLPPKYLNIYISSFLLFVNLCSAMSRHSFAILERAADIQQVRAA